MVIASWYIFRRRKFRREDRQNPRIAAIPVQRTGFLLQKRGQLREQIRTKFASECERVQIKKESDVEEGEEKRNFLITDKTRTHVGVAEQKKKKERKERGMTRRGQPVLRYSCFQIIYDPRYELPHALCETQLVRLTRTL